jgi:hypothetical protein
VPTERGTHTNGTAYPLALPTHEVLTQVHHTHTHTHTSPTGKGAHAPGQGRAKALTPQPRVIAEIAAVVRVHVRDGGWREACPPNKSLTSGKTQSVGMGWCWFILNKTHQFFFNKTIEPHTHVMSNENKFPLNSLTSGKQSGVLIRTRSTRSVSLFFGGETLQLL